MISAITSVLQTRTADKLLAAFLAPGTGFMEDKFSSEGGMQRWFRYYSHKERAA